MSARDIIADGLPRGLLGADTDAADRLARADDILKALENQGFRITERADETAAGMAAPGLPGALYRLLDRCDYRNVDGWLRGEILRGTEDRFILDATAGMVSSCVLQVAGRRARTMVRETGRQIMTSAAHLLENDFQAVLKAKKEDTVLRNNIHVVPLNR